MVKENHREHNSGGPPQQGKTHPCVFSHSAAKTYTPFGAFCSRVAVFVPCCPVPRPEDLRKLGVLGLGQPLGSKKSLALTFLSMDHRDNSFLCLALGTPHIVAFFPQRREEQLDPFGRPILENDQPLPHGENSLGLV